MELGYQSLPLLLLSHLPSPYSRTEHTLTVEHPSAESAIIPRASCACAKRGGEFISCRDLLFGRERERERERELAMAEFLRSRSSTTSSLAMQESSFKASLARCVLRSSLCTYAVCAVVFVIVFQKLCVFVNKGTDLMKGDTFGLRCVCVCV